MQKPCYFRLILFKMKSKEKIMQKDMGLNKTKVHSELKIILQLLVPSY